jgi:hypothetical protein
MKALLLLSALVLIALPAQAVVYCYSWEDGGTVLGSSLAVNITNVTGPQTGLCGDCAGGSYSCPGAYDGAYYLHAAESPHSGTPQLWVAWVTGLNTGDVVTASFYGYDITADPAGPSLRIWGAFTDGVNVAVSLGSAVPASPVPLYTPGNPPGWGITQYTYLPVIAGAVGLRVEARLYSTPSSGTYTTDYWVDEVCVEVPDYAVIHFPAGASPVSDSTWSTLKALYR